ncbi:MAG: serine/threonine-protein kinase [Vulcanimicrobiota bacterium]
MLKEGQDQRLGSVIQERYRLEAFLARGGMGAVFLCEDLRLAGQKWAIKEMLSASPAEAALVRDSFRREAEMLARLRHPSLPAIVDSFVEGQHHYLVMEYIPGLTLARHIQESGPADQNRATRWGVELAGVLAYLHGQQPPVIFRDLKPENIMVSEGGALKLVDFGLARHFRQGQRRDTQAVGSVGYSPPEQWQDQEQSDQRSDIYGWGAVLHFVLSGKPPSPSYSRQKLREYRPDLNGRLEAVVLKCLEPQPGLRYQTSQDLLRALQGDSGHGEASPKRRRPPWLALAGLLLALLVCLAWWPGAGPAARPTRCNCPSWWRGARRSRRL